MTLITIINFSAAMAAVIFIAAILLFIFGGQISCGVPDDVSFLGINLFFVVLPFPVFIGVASGLIIKISHGVIPDSINGLLILCAFFCIFYIYGYKRSKAKKYAR